MSKRTRYPVGVELTAAVLIFVVSIAASISSWLLCVWISIRMLQWIGAL